MAHRIEEMDIQQGIEMAWHGLTQLEKEITLGTEEKPGNIILNQWDCEPVELLADGQETGYSMLRCTDNKKIIGKPFAPDTYSPIYNRRFLQIVRDSLAGTGHKIVSAGSVCNRGRVFISVQLDGKLEQFKAAGREFESFLNFLNSFDQTTVFECKTSNICTVCNNTFSMNLRHKGKLVNARVKHTKNASDALDNLPELIDAAIGVQAEFAAALSSLSKVKTDETKAKRIFTGFLVPQSNLDGAKRLSDAISTRSQNTVSRLAELFREGAGNRGKDLSDVFQAATDFYSHESSGKGQEVNRTSANLLKQFESSEFGSGARKKAEFFEMINDSEKREETEARGAKTLELPVF